MTLLHFKIGIAGDYMSQISEVFWLYNLQRENFGAATGGMFFPGRNRGEMLRKRWTWEKKKKKKSRASFSTETLDSSHVEG